MSRSMFKWIAIYADDTTESVSSTTLEGATALLEGDTDEVVALIRQDLAWH